ncbi:MAG: hypothetical protein IJT91_06180 [Clostridia bacterium]|nr:hypothetical protein [Clostridia bacterium]
MHTHILCGTDDGAKDEKVMYAMLDAAYSDGTRAICFTPHYHPGYYGDNRQKADKAFALASEYAKKYVDLRLCRGNELHYSPDCISWIRSGACLSLNGTDHILIDFDYSESEATIVKAINSIMNTGYSPVLAHAERYAELSVGNIRAMHEDGVVIQLDSQSITGEFGLKSKQRCKTLLKHYVADLVSSDAHDTSKRVPTLGGCFDHVSKKYGEDYAEFLFGRNAERILFPDEREKEVNK